VVKKLEEGWKKISEALGAGIRYYKEKGWV
jgi:hypothetical protein